MRDRKRERQKRGRSSFQTMRKVKMVWRDRGRVGGGSSVVQQEL